MKAKGRLTLKIISVLVLTALYIFYNSLRFTYQYFYSLGNASVINPIWLEFIQPFFFGFIFVMMIFLLIENKKHIFVIAGIALAFLVFYQPSVFTYEKTMLAYNPENLIRLNHFVSALKQIDVLHILNTAYYKKEVSAIAVSCLILYISKDFKVTYSLSKQKLLAIEALISILSVIYCLYSFRLIPEFKINLYLFISVLVVVACFLIAKGFSRLLLLQADKDQKMLALVLTAIPWSFNMAINPYYNYLLNEAVLFVIPFILTGLFVFICYTAERLNQIKENIPH